ncbi:MAG TPA: DHH family phosphoesterase [Candidatus Saccharimonadales bacterium]|nr:DHH family phosphoesterase [Candidatus Saccharimonadales bacterium]
MTEYEQATQIREAIERAEDIVIVQADNPDTDSLASSLVLEEILAELGKKPYLYCGVDLPSYLSYLPGSDRVSIELPTKFDLSIIVDTSSDTLLEQLSKSGTKAWLAAKPSIVIDHHATKPTISFAKIICNHPAVATGEVIYELANQLDWPLNQRAKELTAMAILSDSLGLTSEATTARSIHIIGELVEGGVELAQLENARRDNMRREPELVHYKGRLLQRVEFHSQGRIASITIPQDEIDKFSPLYNPSMLVLDDMRLAKKVEAAIAFKIYVDGKVTAKIRCNYGRGIGNKLAEHFGGGGHPYAAGFKIQNGRSYEEIKAECLKVATELLDEFGKDRAHEAV